MQPDINKFKDKIKIDMKVSNWDQIIDPYIDSKAFEDMFNFLVDSVNDGRRFTPQFKDVFNAFKECNYNDLKVVIVGQDPYPQIGSADGLAFSCSNKGKAEKSLQYILKQTIGDLTDTGRVVYTPEECDLRRWAKQSVLLINTALTVEVNKIGSHFWNWKPFTEYLFTKLNKTNKDIVFILMGKKAESWQLLLSNQKLLKCSHPASAAYKGGIWNSNDVFNKTNIELKNQNKTLVNW